MLRNSHKILFVIFGLFLVGNSLAQVILFPSETMLSRIERINEMGKDNGKSITFESLFLQGINATPLETTSTDIETWLRLSLENTPLTYREINAARFVIVRRRNEKPTNGYLAGKITDMFGTPIAGATVMVQSVQKGTMTGLNGDYTLPLSTGVFTVEIRFLGCESIRVEGVEIGSKKTTRLDAALKESNVSLNEIIVTQIPLESTIIGALRAQRNTPYVSTVLAKQQIEYSAANTIRDALQLVPTITITENNDMIVRGAGGRWNEIAIDGIPTPNYDRAYSIFSFDMLPLSLVDNIRLLKSSTPDVPVSFGNTMTDIITKDIPEQNFLQLKAEFQFNSQSTFLNQRGRKRGKWDWIGLDDKSREFPDNIMQIPAEHFTILNRKTPPSQQYSVTVGRTHELKNKRGRMGMLLSLSYRNTQQQSVIEHTQRGRWKSIGQYTGNMNGTQNTGHTYGYNTVTGGVLNVGWQFYKSRISFRNIFTRNFENDLTEITQHLEDISDNGKNLSCQFFNYPTFFDLLQNKLEGKHFVNNIAVKWDVSHTLMRRERKDAAFSEMYKPLRDDSLLYFLHNNPQLKDKYPASSGEYKNKEQCFRASLSASFPFRWRSLNNQLTLGYNANYKHIQYESGEWMLQYKNNPFPEIFQTYERNNFEKKLIEHFPFTMLEHRWNKKVRVAWGVRANYQNSVRKWEFMPSINFTFLPAKDFNLRLGYYRSVIHPQLADYIPFPVYDTQLLGTSINRPIRSSSVHAVDLLVDKQINNLDYISVGLFYRYMNHPIERTTYQYGQDEQMYVLQNSNKALNYGIEANIRKRLDFLADADFMRRFQLSAAIMLTHSSVQGKKMERKDKGDFIETESLQIRPLSGQMPYLFNMGLNYSGENLHANILFNRSSRQLFVLGEKAYQHEYKAPFNSLNATVSYRFSQSGILLKLSAKNLLNSKQIFYTNTEEDYVRDEFGFATDNLLPGKSENFDRGHDPIIHETHHGRTFSFSVSRTF